MHKKKKTKGENQRKKEEETNGFRKRQNIKGRKEKKGK